jgi:hypothetical protein
MFRGLLHGLQMGAMTHPILASHTCPPTSAMLGHPSNEHRPRRRPVTASASAIHEPVRYGTASALPSMFHASTGSRRRRMSPIAGRMSSRVTYSYSPPSVLPAGRTVARRRCARATVCRFESEVPKPIVNKSLFSSFCARTRGDGDASRARMEILEIQQSRLSAVDARAAALKVSRQGNHAGVRDGQAFNQPTHGNRTHGVAHF